MSIYSIPMLISGILCALLAVTTWMFRRRESINRMFAVFTTALAVDSFAFFSWFQFGSVESIDTWMRLTFSAGFVVPTGLVLFFFAFTGYDKRLNEKVWGLKTGYFRNAVLVFVFGCVLLSQFTNLLIRIPEQPEHIWDVGFGPIGNLMFPTYAVIFAYLYVMVFKAYKTTESKSQRHFILMLASGTAVWLLFGYVGAALFPISSTTWNSISYLGTGLMGIFYFIAILNYQFDKVTELNLNLERKVEERTRHLEETRLQLVQSEKMAALGHLVAGVAHEMNTPVGAVYSTHGTLISAMEKLKNTLESEHGISVNDSSKLSGIMKAIAGISEVIKSSGERITGIVKKLRNFARLDEADLQSVDFNECIDHTISVFQFHLKPGVTIRKEFAELPPVTCYPAEINQLCFQLLSNANRAIKDSGEIVLRTEQAGDEIRFSVTDNGRGIDRKHLDRVFDPGFTAWDLNVGTGLGLAICYQIAQEHKGRITVESELGKGSRFVLTIPVNQTIPRENEVSPPLKSRQRHNM